MAEPVIVPQAVLDGIVEAREFGISYGFEAEEKKA